VLAVCKAAEWNAFSSINLRNQKFATTPVLVDLARKYANDEPTAASVAADAMFSISVETFVGTYLQSSPETESSASS
jgi:hypothetical protein